MKWELNIYIVDCEFCIDSSAAGRRSLSAAVRAGMDITLRNAQYQRLHAGRKLNQQSFRLKMSGLTGAASFSCCPRIAVPDSSSVLSVNCKSDNLTTYCTIYGYLTVYIPELHKTCRAAARRCADAPPHDGGDDDGGAPDGQPLCSCQSTQARRHGVEGTDSGAWFEACPVQVRSTGAGAGGRRGKMSGQPPVFCGLLRRMGTWSASRHCWTSSCTSRRM